MTRNNKIGIISTWLLLLCMLSACPVRPESNINGSWSRGSKARIVIKGNSGTLTGENGKSIPIKVEYQKNGNIIIREINHTPGFLENYIPKEVAIQIYTNALVRNTYYQLTRETNGNLTAHIYAWEVFYDYDYKPYYIIPKDFIETWETK